jgi:hypothetical protein
MFVYTNGDAQTDTGKWVRAFPITSYVLDLNDTIKLVQIQLPDGYPRVIREKQLGVLRGAYDKSHEDTAQKGYGKCNLIKGDYYYFTISHNKSYMAPREGDLVYTTTDRTNIYYGQLIRLASHFIGLANVYEERMYDRYLIFNQWTKAEEDQLLDTLAGDVRFTGNHFLANDPSMNKDIKDGEFKGRKVLEVMAACTPDNLRAFFDYIIARPRLYAGRQWKIAEIFATWLVEGAPMVIKN